MKAIERDAHQRAIERAWLIYLAHGSFRYSFPGQFKRRQPQ